MVVINIKRGDEDGFLYETTCATTNDALIRDLVTFYTLTTTHNAASNTRMDTISCTILG